MMKANPDDYSEQQKQAKKARAKYEERCVIHLNPVCVSHSPQGIGILVRPNSSLGAMRHHTKHWGRKDTTHWQQKRRRVHAIMTWSGSCIRTSEGKGASDGRGGTRGM
jgi:hypothetical protein